MFSRFRVSSVTDMKRCIFDFLQAVLHISIGSQSGVKVLTSNGKHFLWILPETYGISAWITDVDDTDLYGNSLSKPYLATTTVGLAGYYVGDLKRAYFDAAATAAAQADARRDMEAEIKARYGSLTPTFTNTCDKVRFETLVDSMNDDIDDIKEYYMDWDRTNDYNVFHVGGALRWSDIISDNSWLWLDCHYSNNTFSFCLYEDCIPNVTRTLTIGEFTPYHDSVLQNCYILSNCFHLVSEDKVPGHDDSMPIEGDDGKTYCTTIRGETRVVTYDNELLRLIQVDIDNQKEDKPYKVNGVDVGFRVSLAPEHLKIFKLSNELDGNPPGKFITGNMKILSWEYRLLRCSYECEESKIGVNYYPLLDTEKRDYEVYDDLDIMYKTFSGFRRSGTGGDSVNILDNNSEPMPIIFYVKRDPKSLDDWSAIGETRVVSYINMYNLCTGSFSRLRFTLDDNGFACYNLYRRRSEYTAFNKVENIYLPGHHRYDSAWGFGGMPGLAIRYDRSSLCLGRGDEVA